MNEQLKQIHPQVTRQAILVLGMHRSGTSALGGVLACLGAQAPKTLMTPTKDNPKGYWESRELQKVHDQLLRTAGSRWNDWGPFNPDWLESSVADRFRELLPAVIESEFDGARLLLIKDPRICRFLPFWTQVLEGLAISPRVVIPIRHPLEVARSLATRDSFGLDGALLLWLRHVLDAEFNSRSLIRTFVRYDDLLDDWRGLAHRVGSDLGIKWPRLSSDTEAEINQFLAPDLRHHDARGASMAGHSELSGWATSVYRVLSECRNGAPSEDGLRTLDRIRHEFDRSASIYAPVVREHELRMERINAENGAKLAEKAKEHEAAMIRLQGAQDLIETQEHELAEQRMKTAELSETSESLREMLAALLKQQESRDAELKEARDEFKSLQARMSSEQADAQAAIAKLESEGNALKLRLADRFREIAALAQLVEQLERGLRDARSTVSTVEARAVRDISVLQEELNSVRLAHQAQSSRVQELLMSHSWRITHPLRVVMTLLKRW